MNPGRVVVVGGGVAGLTAIRTLRDEGYAGEIVLLGDEPSTPYARPPLSKEALKRGPAHDAVALMTDDALDRLGVAFHRGDQAVALDIAARHVVSSSGTFRYDALILATGVRPRIPTWAHDGRGIHVLRSLADAQRLYATLDTCATVLVVGAGFLGTELAATARALGRGVTLVEVQSSPMQHQLGLLVSQRLATLHEAHGVRLECSSAVAALVGSEGGATGVRCADGKTIEADAVIVAAGAEPDTAWLFESGLVVGDGIECNAQCAAAPNVYAAGDIASWPSARFGRRLRLEHQMNAVEQAAVAARNVLGANERYDPIPYFWSDQYDVKVQVHGLIESGSEVRVLHGDVDGRSFVVGYFDAADTLRGVLGWNAVREVRKLRANVGHVLPHDTLVTSVSS